MVCLRAWASIIQHDVSGCAQQRDHEEESQKSLSRDEKTGSRSRQHTGGKWDMSAAKDRESE